ncbi:hypothetical protein ACETC7_001619 [Neisseria gonorrhoeae]
MARRTIIMQWSRARVLIARCSWSPSTGRSDCFPKGSTRALTLKIGICTAIASVILGFVTQFCRETESPQAGDIAVWRFGRSFSHGGILAGGGKVIHSYIGRGVVSDDIGQAELIGRGVRFFTFSF